MRDNNRLVLRVLVRAYRTGNCTRADGSCAETIARFIWDGAQVLGELRANGATGAPLETQVSTGTYTGRVRYVHAPVWRGIDVPLSASKDGTLIVPHADWRGLPLAGSTASGALASTGIAWPGAAARIRIDPAMPLAEWWGTLLADQQDATGRRYRRARYYDPAIGQFASEDPIGLAGGRHPYAYADGDPVSYSDPFGLCPVPQLCLAAAGAILGGGGRVLFNLATDRPWTEGALETAIGGAIIGATFGAAAPEAATALFARGAGTAAARAAASVGATASALRLPDANKLSHVFDQAKHNWALTGLDQAGNLNLINNVAANASNLVSTTARNGGNILRYQGVANGFNVVVNVFEKNGVRELSNSWIVK